jgi:hypothetical protein
MEYETRFYEFCFELLFIIIWSKSVCINIRTVPYSVVTLLDVVSSCNWNVYFYMRGINLSLLSDNFLHALLIKSETCEKH